MTGLDRRRRPEDSLDAPPVDDGPAEDMSDEALARLGASLEPIEPPASLRAALLERIEREPRARRTGRTRGRWDGRDSRSGRCRWARGAGGR